MHFKNPPIDIQKIAPKKGLFQLKYSQNTPKITVFFDLGRKNAFLGSETGLKRFFGPGFLYKDSFSDTNFSTFRYNRPIMPIFLKEIASPSEILGFQTKLI